MTSRRDVIKGLLAASIAQPAWADVGNPAFLSAGQKPDGSYVLCGLSAGGDITFTIPLPARGHAAAAHPTKAQAVAFARRPGTFALVINCATGVVTSELAAPAGRHFYGHGVFSADGDLLFTTENDYEAVRGIVGVWDAQSFTRLTEFPSGGIGPHDIKLMPDGGTLVIANGGIETHPDSGRTKLNIPTMQSNLSYLTTTGAPVAQMTLGPAHQRNSIRHLAVARDGRVGFAMQWQGDLAMDLPLRGTHSLGTGKSQLFDQASIRRMAGYLGSIAISNDGQKLATTSPRQGIAQVYDLTGRVMEIEMSDVCGVAPANDDFILTTGEGKILATAGTISEHNIRWDNHVVSI